MQVRGIIDVIEPTVNITEKFKRRIFVLLYQNNPDRIEYLRFEFHQDRCSLLDNYSKGDKVIVSFQLQGNKWTGQGDTLKYYTTLKAWKIEKDINPNFIL